MSRVLTELDREYWSSAVQETLFVENTAIYLAGGDAQSALSADGKKFHKPIISKPRTGTYTPYSDITFKTKTATDQELNADQIDYAAEEIDDVDAKQNWYNALEHAGMSMQKQLNNRIEQYYLSQVSGAKHTVDAGSVGGSSGSNIELSASNISQIFTASHTKLDSVDAPMAGRVAVVGAHTLGVMRDMKGNRESTLGDTVLQDGRVGPMQGWEIVYNNNLPWTGTIELPTTPTNLDKVVIAGVPFELRTTVGTGTSGYYGVLFTSAADAKTNLKHAIEGTGTAGTHYIALSEEDAFILREKRRVTAEISTNDLVCKGYGDIVVSETFTSANNFWKDQKQTSLFAVRGAIDLVVQLGKTLEMTRKEKGFADLIKALSLYGAKMFDDGAMVSCKVNIDASNWA